MMPKGPRKAGYTVFPGTHNAFRITSTVGPLNSQNMLDTDTHSMLLYLYYQ